LAFNLNVLKGFIPIFSDYSKMTIGELAPHVNGGEFNLHKYSAQLVFRVTSGNLSVTTMATSSVGGSYDRHMT
jgi:hypothetical protein